MSKVFSIVKPVAFVSLKFTEVKSYGLKSKVSLDFSYPCFLPNLIPIVTGKPDNRCSKQSKFKKGRQKQLKGESRQREILGTLILINACPRREGNGIPLQYSCLENSMDGRAWQAAVHEVAKSRTRLSNFTFTFQFHALKKEMATHSSVLACRNPGTGEPGVLPSMTSHRVGHD